MGLSLGPPPHWGQTGHLVRSYVGYRVVAKAWQQQ